MSINNIPKTIHYCWFGGNPLPDEALRCIESWKKYCPDYEIKRWDEKNFNINICEYVLSAYREKKWAFVSDYARFWILYNYGGIYFDVDVELLKPIDSIISQGQFVGCEKVDYDKYKTEVILRELKRTNNQRLIDCYNEERIRDIKYGVNPGLGIGLKRHSWFALNMITQYESRCLYDSNNNIQAVNVVDLTTIQCLSYGVCSFDKTVTVKVQNDEELSIYPVEFFCPMDYTTGNLNITEHTYSIHHYKESWLSKPKRIENNIIKWFNRHNIKTPSVVRFVTLPFRIMNKTVELGIRKTIVFALRKISGGQ